MLATFGASPAVPVIGGRPCTGTCVQRSCAFTPGAAAVVSRPRRTTYVVGASQRHPRFSIDDRSRVIFHCQAGAEKQQAGAEERAMEPARIVINEKQELLDACRDLEYGVLATPAQREAVHAAVERLERAGSSSAQIDFLADGLEPISGLWSLLYTSSLEIPRSPATKVKGIFQRIQPTKKRIENIVRLELAVPGSSFLKPLEALLPKSQLSLVIGASFQVISKQRVSLCITDTTLRPQRTRPLRLTPLSPFSRDDAGDFFFASLRPQGYFDVTYLDDSLRISRGSRGEIRILVRASYDADADVEAHTAGHEHSTA